MLNNSTKQYLLAFRKCFMNPVSKLNFFVAFATEICHVSLLENEESHEKR